MNAKELRRAMPQDSQDVATAREFVSLGPECLAPVVTEMLRQLKDYQSPVAEVYWEFFANHGEPFAEEVARFLGRTTMDYQKDVIVSRVLPAWSGDSVSVCASQLQMLATTNSGWSGTDLLAIRLLAKHRLADRKWLRDWLDFKRSAFERLSLLAEQVAIELE